MIQNPLAPLEFNITKDELKKLKPLERKKLIQSLLLEVIRKNPNGITISIMEKLTNFDRATISKHVEYLVAIREAYRYEAGNTTLYYPNGKLIHSKFVNNHQIGEKFYSFLLIKNPFGEFLYIQEKIKDMYNTFSVEGGLIIQKEQLKAFRDILNDIISQVDE